ncbi:MAG TPA: hypothetical protein P5074_11105 [Candidatus Nanopelagicales bacterium]|nr:hypothetical protein [Candidatus Nanopelagicales bacterium]
MSSNATQSTASSQSIVASAWLSPRAIVRASGIAAVAVTPITYAVVRHANEVYANELGTTPEMLGATENVLIAKTVLVGVIVGVFLVTTIAASGAGWVMGSVFSHFLEVHLPKFHRHLTGNGSQGGSWLKRFGRWAVQLLPLIAALGIASVGMLLVAVSTTAKGAEGAWLVGGLALFMFGIGLVTRFIGGDVDSGGNRLVALGEFPGVRRLSVLLLTASFAWLVFAMTSGLEQSAKTEAERVLRGENRSDGVFTPLLLAGRPVPAQVAMLGDTDPLSLCDGRSVTALLTTDSRSLLLVVYPASSTYPLTTRSHDVHVVHAPHELYAVTTGLSDFGKCSTEPMRP